MNCETYLSMITTLSVNELAYGDAGAHAANCRDCDRVTRVVVERERNMVLAYGELYPSTAAGPMAAHALVISRRRRTAFYYRFVLGIAMAATVVFLIMSRRLTPAPSVNVTETFRLQCLSPEQALEVLRPIIPPSVSMSARPSSPVGVIRVGASPAEMERVRSVLERYDTPTQSQCGVQLTVPKVIRAP